MVLALYTELGLHPGQSLCEEQARSVLVILAAGGKADEAKQLLLKDANEQWAEKVHGSSLTPTIDEVTAAAINARLAELAAPKNNIPRQ